MKQVLLLLVVFVSVSPLVWAEGLNKVVPKETVVFYFASTPSSPKPTNHLALLSDSASKRICDEVTLHNDGKSRNGATQQIGFGPRGKIFYTKDLVFAFGCDDRLGLDNAMMHIAEFPEGESELQKVKVGEHRYQTVKFYGSSAEHLYRAWDTEIGESRGRDADGNDVYFPTKIFKDKAGDMRVMLKCKTGIDAHGDGEDFVIRREQGVDKYYECWAAIRSDGAIEMTEELMKKMRQNRKGPPPQHGGQGQHQQGHHQGGGQVAPVQPVQNRWEVATKNGVKILTDHRMRVQWALKLDRGTQATTARSMGEADGICASIGFKLPRVNSFMEVSVSGGQVTGVSKSQTREYWPMVFKTFAPHIASGSPRFFTGDNGPFPLLGHSVVIFQPHRYPKWDMYSTRKQVYATALCVRSF